MKRSSKVMSFFLALTMVITVFAVSPRTVVKAAEITDCDTISTTKRKVKDDMVTISYTPNKTLYYVFRCDAWRLNDNGYTTSTVIYRPGVVDRENGELLTPCSSDNYKSMSDFLLEKGKTYDITFQTKDFTDAEITIAAAHFDCSWSTVYVDYGGTVTLDPKAYSTYGPVSYKWDDGSTEPTLTLENVCKNEYITCTLTFNTDEGPQSRYCYLLAMISNNDIHFKDLKTEPEVNEVPYGTDKKVELVSDVYDLSSCDFQWSAGSNEISGTGAAITVKNVTAPVIVVAEIRRTGERIGSYRIKLVPANDLTVSVKGAEEITTNDRHLRNFYGYNSFSPKIYWISYDRSKGTTLEAVVKANDLTDCSVTWIMPGITEEMLGNEKTLEIPPDSNAADFIDIRVEAVDKYGTTVSCALILVNKDVESAMRNIESTEKVLIGGDITLSVDPLIDIERYGVYWRKYDKAHNTITEFTYPSSDVSSVTLKNVQEDCDIYYRSGAYVHMFHIQAVTYMPTATTQPTATATPKATTAPTGKPTAKPTGVVTPTDGAKPTDKVAPTTTPTTAPTDQDPKAQILAFVERIYIYVLDREPEAEGAAFWSDELYSFRRTGAEVAQGFIFSEEFINRNTSDKEFVTILYKTFFGRDPEEEGFNYWVGELASGSKDRVTVANGFIYSQEWADTCAAYGIRSGGDLKPSGAIEPTELTYAFVERMYTTALGRGYDEEGKQYWASELANFNITGESVGAFFFLSDEMNGYGLSDQEYLNRLYATFMNREPDADGAAYWLSVLSSGTTRADVVFGFTRSPEFTEKCVEARILPY